MVWSFHLVLIFVAVFVLYFCNLWMIWWLRCSARCGLRHMSYVLGRNWWFDHVIWRLYLSMFGCCMAIVIWNVVAKIRTWLFESGGERSNEWFNSKINSFKFFWIGSTLDIIKIDIYPLYLILLYNINTCEDR